jgi:hypothetical protein
MASFNARLRDELHIFHCRNCLPCREILSRPVAALTSMSPLIRKRAPSGWNQEDYEVLEDSVVVGRIFLMPPLD